MARIAIIENNIVSNLIIGDQNFADNYNGTAILLNDDTVKIGFSYDGVNFTEPIKSQNEIESEAREWRNIELQSTDFIVPLTDYPNHAAWITYRQTLRNWPSTDDFPNTKPIAPAEL